MKALSHQDTNILKGVALLLLLIHHCLYTGEGYNDFVVFGHPVFRSVGQFSKLCVALFVFLSGYGLTAKAESTDGIGNVWSFYRRRYMKLMSDFWVVYLLFVPVGVIFFQRTFRSVYGVGIWYKAILDFLGIYKAVIGDFNGYNATWWFLSLIIVLYLIYPCLWKCRRFGFLMIPFGIMFPTWASFIPLIGSSDVGHYLLAFICGIAFASNRHTLSELSFNRGGGRLFLVLLFLLACLFRFIAWNPYIWDAAIITFGIVLYCTFTIPRWLSKVLSFLGKHSYNVFLFHSFIYYYYLHDVIFWSKNPVLIPVTLLLVCIPISMGIEWLKHVCRYERVRSFLVG